MLNTKKGNMAVAIGIVISLIVIVGSFVYLTWDFWMRMYAIGLG
jgi:hypothetical protein